MDSKQLSINQLQPYWDRMLLHQFFIDFNNTAKRSRTMGMVMHQFMVLFDVSEGIFEQLKRAPRFPAQHKMGVSRFVCGYLPRLARILLDGGKTESDVSQLAIKLQGWSIDTLRNDSKANAEKAEVRASVKSAEANRIAYGLERDHYAACNKHSKIMGRAKL